MPTTQEYDLTTMQMKQRRSLAIALEPGDATHYEMVVVEMQDTYEVIVLNDGFFDRICFLKKGLFAEGKVAEPYETHRRKWDGKETNPWTIRAAKILLNLFIKEKEET